MIVGSRSAHDRSPSEPESTGCIVQLRTANSWTQNVPVLMWGKDSCVAQVHPDDAGRLGLVDGATARVSSAAGSIDVPVVLTDSIMPA